MANPFRGARSPFYYYYSSVSANSAKLEITINGTLVYTLIKTSLIDNEANFEVSELIRDYIDVLYEGTMSTAPLADYGATVVLTIRLYASEDASGTQLGSKSVTLDFYDAYAYFDDEDPEFDVPPSTHLISNNTIWLPEGVGGSIYYLDASSDVTLLSISTNATQFSGVPGELNYVKRYPCSKYDPKKLVFINRFGVPQELWFFGKTIENSSIKSDKYKTSRITPRGVFSKYEHQFKSFDVNGTTSYTLNSAFISEDYNEFMKELMLSEKVWLHIDGDVRPVTVTSTDVTYKTSLNDKLVEYTVKVEQANDLISSMR
jgi:hypothetical protein